MPKVEAYIDDDGEIKLPDYILERMDDKESLLRSIGELILSHARRAFTDQRLGDFQWPERYPAQTGAKLNLAGAIKDLTQGPSIQSHRFQGRPAGVDTGALRDSLDSQSGALRLTGEGSIIVGSRLPYAEIQQSGGISSIPITPSAKMNLKRLLKIPGPNQKIIRERLGFVLNKKLNLQSLIQKVHARPHIGITDDMRDEIDELLDEELTSVRG